MLRKCGLGLIILMCGLVLFTSCARRGCRCRDCRCALRENITREPERLVYIALGDSVSEGFGIWSPEDRHTSVFFELLKEQGLANEYVNLAVSGFTTTDLLQLLNGPEEIEPMPYASVITLNIGGNNILAPFWAYLPDASEMQRITEETVIFVTEAWALAQELMGFANNSREAVTNVLDFAEEVTDFVDNFGFLDIFRIDEMLAAVPPVIADAMNVFAEVNTLEATVTDMLGRAAELEITGLFPLVTGAFPDELEAGFQASIREFAYELAEILDWLESNAPNAVVIVNTVYNPLPMQLMGMELGFADESRRLIQAINDIIYEESRARGFIVSDVYAGLSNRPDMMNLSFDIIHPNPQGHYAIARLNFADFLQAISE